jgi:hypothetical protein
MIIALTQGVEAKAIAAEGLMELPLGLLGKKGKVELALESLGFLLDVMELLIQPLLDLRGEKVKGISGS